MVSIRQHTGNKDDKEVKMTQRPGSKHDIRLKSETANEKLFIYEKLERRTNL